MAREIENKVRDHFGVVAQAPGIERPEAEDAVDTAVDAAAGK